MANVKDLLVNGSARVIGTIYGNATSANNADKLDGKHLSEIAAAKSTTLAWGASSTIATIGGNNITLTMPANPNTDTHYTTGITAGATGTTSNSATTNGNTFIKIKDNSTHRGQIKIVGSGATSVSSDANGVITINSTDNNTTYGSMSVSEGTTGTATTNRVLTAANLKGIINAHAPTKTGGGASGTWNISISGNAATATKLATTRTIQTNLASTTSASFNGSANITPGVTGILGIGNGGTGANNRKTAITNLGVFGLYDRNDIGTSPNFDNPGVNGFFELRTKTETTGETGTKPYDGFGPFISIKYSNTMFQLAGTNTNGFYIRGKQAANVTLSGVAWQKLLTSGNYTDYTVTKTGTGASGTWGINISGNASTASKLQTARTISLTGSVIGSGTFDGSGNLSITTTTNHNHNSSYVLKSGDTMSGTLKFNDSQQIFFRGKGNSDSVFCKMGFMNGIPSGVTHCVNAYQTTGAFYITSNGYDGANDYGGIAIDNEGITVFGAGDSGNNFTGVFRVINEDNVAAGPIFRVQKDGNAYATKLYGAVWNDYAEYRKSDITEPGRVVIENGDGTLSLSTQRLQRGAEVISDTFGFAIGETDECKTPIAATGRVLAYTYEPVEEYRSKTGWAVCSGPNGTVSIMTEEEEEKYPSRIIGTISEVPDYEEWGTGKVKTNGRVWIRIK